MILDLTHQLGPNTPVYPGDPSPRITQLNNVGSDGFTDHSFTLGTHVGTHIDAPAHMIPGGKNLSQYPPSRFVGRGIIVDVTTEFTLSALKSAHVQPGDIVVLRTGLSQHFRDPDYFTNSPAIPEYIAKHLVAQRVSMVGIDMGTVDRPPFPIHKILLDGDVLIIENLTNLERLPEVCTIIALPLNLALDGSPCRVIAFTEPIPAPHQTP